MAEDKDEATQAQRDELLQLQVKLLLQSIESGEAAIAPHLSDITEDLSKVKLDRRGLPILSPCRNACGHWPVPGP